ncbi:PKD domain-containing protein [Methanohalophilus mahii]|nr:PKD domain-containing protein [Methanohalophilus mahii]
MAMADSGEDSSIGGVRAAEKDGCMFLGSDFIEVGILPNGGFGADTNAPESFFGSERSGGIGLYADLDGFYNDTYDYRYDYFLPGSPEERWSVGFMKDGTKYSDSNGRNAGYNIPTTITNITNSKTGHITVDSIYEDKLVINQTYELKPTERFLKVNVTLTNAGPDMMENVRYQRSFDPDNGVDVGCNYATKNTIVSQQGTSNKAIVKAELKDGDLSTDIGQISSIPIFYYTQDEDARVSYGSSGLIPNNPPYGDLDWDSAPSEGDSVEADSYIALTFNKSSLAPGQSVDYTFYIGLTKNIDETISDVEEDAGNTDSSPSIFNSTPEAFFINNDGTNRDVNTNFTFAYSGENVSLMTQLNNSSVTAVTANFSTIPGEPAGQIPFEYHGEGIFTLLNHTLPDSEPGIYYITILANSSGQMNSTICPVMLNFNPKTDISGLANPNTTDWTTIDDLTNVSNLTFEANDGNGNVIGSMEFTETVNLCDIEFAQKLQQFGEYVNFATAQTTLDSENLSRLNVSSNLTMRGLESFDSQPGILLNDQPILQTGQTSNGSVSGLQWDAENGTLSFSTEHWSTYTADGEAPEVNPNSPVAEIIGPGSLLELNVSVSDTSTVSSVVVNVSSINNTIDEAILSNNNDYWTNNSVIADVTIDGQYDLNINATDAVGNSNSSVNCSVIMDSLPPEIEISGNFTQWQNSSALIDVSLNDDNEIAKVKWDSGDYEASHFATNGNEISSPYDFTVTSNGSYTVYAQDAAGNENISVVHVSKIDTTDAIVIFGTNGNNTYSNIHSTTVSASDALSGIEKLEYSWTQTEESAGSWQGFTNDAILSKEDVDGDWYLHIRATDNASNINHSVSNVFKFDSNSPEINAVEHPVNVNTGDTIEIGFNVTDNIGITSTEFNISTNDTAELTKNDNWYNYTLNVPVDSVEDIVFNATFYDDAGNLNASGDKTINVSDNIPPVIQYIVYEEDVNTGQTTVISFNVTDNIEITSTEFNISTNDTAELNENGNWYNYTLNVPIDSVEDIVFNATFYDDAGNYNASGDKTINVSDNIAPVIQYIVYEEDVNTGQTTVIGFNVSDNIGITSTEFNISTNDTSELTKNDNWYNYTLNVPMDSVEDIVFNATFYDDAGNYNTSGDKTINVSDNIKPSYNWSDKVQSANTGDNITIKINATDNIGVEMYNITVDGEEYQMKEDSGNYTHNISIPASDSGTLVSSITYNCTFGDAAGNMNSTGDVVIDVSILPIADFSANVTRGTQPLSVEFTDNSSGLVDTWNWDFGDGNTSTNQGPSHVFGAGNFTVNLTVNNTNGTSTKYLNIRAAYEPAYTVSPNKTELLTTYGEERNFNINSTLYSSYEWFIDGTPLNGTGVTLYNNNTDDSAHMSYCNVNTSQYINQDDFFMDVYNVSAHVSNESLGRTDVFSWQWTVTKSSANDADDIDQIINTIPQVNTSGNESHVRFNTSNQTSKKTGVECSIDFVSFNTSNETDDIQIKIEVLNTSALNESEIDFSKGSVYQYMDISFNNESLVNDGSKNRSIEFKVMNNVDGGSLLIDTVYLKHKSTSGWQSYEPELLRNDGTYSYFIVRDIPGFSPFAVTADYKYDSGSKSDDGIPAYLKLQMLQNGSVTMDDEEIVTPEPESDSGTVQEDTTSDSSEQTTDDVPKSDEEDSSQSLFIGIGVLALIAILVLVFKKREN